MKTIKTICTIFIFILAALVIDEKVNSQELSGVAKHYAEIENHQNNSSISGIAEINEFQNLILIIPKASQITISLHDVKGNMIKLIKFEYISAGKYEISLKNQTQPGNYICKVSIGKYEETLNYIIQ